MEKGNICAHGFFTCVCVHERSIYFPRECVRPSVFLSVLILVHREISDIPFDGAKRTLQVCHFKEKAVQGEAGTKYYSPLTVA